jgi:hypothetical protein
MALVPVGSDHSVAGIIHAQILRDDAQTDPQQAFFAQLNAPGVPQQTLPLNNDASIEFPVHAGHFPATIRAEVDNFTVLPAGAAAGQATAISCQVVFKLKEFFTLTIGHINVTSSLK